jgi:hypothetical protein
MSQARRVIGLLVVIVFSVLEVRAQNDFTITATRISDDSQITIDGILSEDIWQQYEVVSGFTQSAPSDGIPASEKTEVRVVYSNKYIYVGAKAFDSQPDSIMANLFRRDGSDASDWIYVNIDSYNDDRTAFTFASNPVGVQKDIMYFDDAGEDVLWDAVWEVQTKLNSDGWTAEFRIPLSQLRFTSSSTEQNWGINFQRRIARRAEISFWARTPREEYGVVSKFGELLGVQDLDRPTRLEIMPYVLSEYTRDDAGTTINPFYDRDDFDFKIGGDIKYGITSDFTLTATLNPDFGQVEADPATINLSEFELFFEERRPFFLEGVDIFNYGGSTSQNSFRNHTNFYSRRIGRTPFALAQGLYQDESNGEILNMDFTSRNPVTTIAGAAKVSGKTENGLSVGLLNSYTLEETVEFYDFTQDQEGSIVAEPATNYFVGRVRQDLSKVDAQIGGFVSSVNREFSGSFLKELMHESAYQVGLDAQYYWKERNWGASGVFNLSNINGTANSLLNTQQTSARYFNRIDSDGLSVDSSLTSMTGYFGEFSIGKYGGNGLRYSFTYSEMSPEYEINDIGFLERADYRAPHYYLEYLNVDSDLFQFYWLWGEASHAWNFDGDMIFNYYNLSGYFQLHNFWTVFTSTGFTGRFYNDRIARGGPTMLRPKDWNTFLQVTTDASKNIFGDISGSYRSDASGEYQIAFDVGFNARVASNFNLKVAPGYIQSKDNDQYSFLNGFLWDPTTSVLFSSVDVNVLYTEIRADITFSPNLSLQTFVRPYYYTADFYNFKSFSESKTFNFTPIDVVTDQEYDLNYDDEFQSLQGNAVLRWEYRPGSTLFFVWQQDRTFFTSGAADFDPFGGTLETFQNDPVNIFLIKLSYWLGS